jgi:Fe-Mn family superoxide dismutase
VAAQHYLKYQSKRPDYVGAFWNVINWDEVARRFTAARSKAEMDGDV